MRKVRISKVAKGTVIEEGDKWCQKKLIAETMEDERILTQNAIDKKSKKLAKKINKLVDQFEDETGQSFGTHVKVIRENNFSVGLGWGKGGNLRDRIERVGYYIGRGWSFDSFAVYENWIENSMERGFNKGRHDRLLRLQNK